MRKVAVFVIAIVAVSLSCAVFAESLTDLYDETGMEYLSAMSFYGAALRSSAFDPDNYTVIRGDIDDVRMPETPGVYDFHDFSYESEYYSTCLEYTKNGSDGYTTGGATGDLYSMRKNAGRKNSTEGGYTEENIGYNFDDFYAGSLGEKIITIAQNEYTSYYMPHNFITYRLNISGGDYKNDPDGVNANTNVNYAFYWHKDGQEGLIAGTEGTYHQDTSTWEDWGVDDGPKFTSEYMTAKNRLNADLFKDYRGDGYQIEFRVSDNGTNTVNDVFNATIGFHAVTAVGDTYVVPEPPAPLPE
ncbi:MAG: hypothetical protein J6U98_03675 [Abditibacteriota bacterium]|nr:hypothetical protein [Abditibacteriota bacterium]